MNGRYNGQGAPYKDNALLLKTDGTITVKTLNNYGEIKKEIDCKYPEMIPFGRYPVTNAQGQESTLTPFLARTVWRGKRKPLQMEYKYHRITELALVQMFVHETGALIPLPKNPFFDQIYGDVIILGHCCDEFSYPNDQDDQGGTV